MVHPLFIHTVTDLWSFFFQKSVCLLALLCVFSGPTTPAKKPRCPKDHHMSNNAYMLVYTKEGLFSG